MLEHSLLLDAAIYLGAAVVFVPLASRLGLGSVLGYLVAGCVIGPFGLGLVRDVGAILHFAEFGVVLMLFVIGLELEPVRLWAMRGAVFGAGSLQMAACGTALAAAGWALGLPAPAAIVAGAALALSSTAIAVQTMTERGVLGAPLGKVVFGILLFQDIAAIPLIGLVPLLGDRGGGSSPWVGVVTVAAAVAGVVAIGRWATRPALRAIARTNLRDVFTAFALLLVVGIAELMQLAGVSMALGAFLAGVLLASSEYRHALETDIEPFKGLLMGLFFIAVGMSVDFALLASRGGAIVGLVAGFLGLKIAMLLLVSRAAGVPRGRHLPFAALLSQGSEFAFVVFGVASAVRVLPDEWGPILTLVVALSMVATPLVVLAADAIARRLGARETREDDRVDVTDAPIVVAGFGRFGQIVGRLLFASGLRVTVLDHDPDNIDFLRRLGFRVFYGDATRRDLLESAGTERARVLVNAIDDVEASLALVRVARRHFPHVRIVARARNVAHWHELRTLGVEVVERETFESALRAGRETLEALGVRPYEARERADVFRRHNLATLEALHPQWADEERRTALARAAREQFEQQFRHDIEARDRESAHGWDPAAARRRTPAG